MANIKEMTLSDLQPYILGKEHFPVKKTEVVRCDQKVLEDFLTMLEADSIAKEFFDSYKNPKDFYLTMKDFFHFIPKEQQNEVFYAAKNGKLYYEVPSSCVYVLQRAYKEAHEIPNLVLKLIPTQLLELWLSEGYLFGDTTLHDVIATVCNANYYPLSVTHVKNKVSNFTELYVKSTDMVAAVPNDIADALSDDSVLSLEVTPDGLTVPGTDIPIRAMGAHLGSVNSTYDLRKCL